MLRRLSSLTVPYARKSLHFKPLIAYSNNNYNPTPHEEWKHFPFIPFLSSNTKLGLFLGIPALAGYLIPHEPIFDVVGAALAVASLPADMKFYSKNPHAPHQRMYGKELTPKVISYAAYATSFLLSFGVMGEYYLISSLFTVFGYLSFMGAYRLATEFIPPEKLTKSQLVSYGALLSSAVMYIFTDLSDVVDGYPVLDLTRLMIPIYLGSSYFVGNKIVNVFDDASRAMMSAPIDPKNLEGDRVQGVLNQLDAWKIEHHMTRFLILYKWVNISAYIVFLLVVALAKSFGVRNNPEITQSPKKQEHLRDDFGATKHE